MPAVDRKNPKRCKSSDSTYSLTEFVRDYPDDDACLEYLWRTRWSEGGKHAHCPKCDQEREFKKYATKQRRQSWTCVACGQHVHPTAGTIFEGSATSLHLWFYAMYLMASTRCGISAKQLERELGVTYKTAWRIANKIRNQLMADDGEPLDGNVEVDETYVGGKVRAADILRHRRSPYPKQAGIEWARRKRTTVFGWSSAADASALSLCRRKALRNGRGSSPRTSPVVLDLHR